jgi:hypothetical protein
VPAAVHRAAPRWLFQAECGGMAATDWRNVSQQLMKCRGRRLMMGEGALSTSRCYELIFIGSWRCERGIGRWRGHWRW